MKKSLIHWVFLSILSFLLPTLVMAMTDQQGTDFWVGFPADSYPTVADNLEILITCLNGSASGQVQVPGISFTSPFVCPQGGSVLVSLPHSALVTIGDGTTAQGVHVTSSNLVSVYGMDSEPYSTDGYLALPTVADGTSYYDISYNASVSTTYGGSFLAVGTENSTSVTINSVNTVGVRTVGVPYTVTLNQGDTYQLLDPTPGDDLTGSSINSDKPIALFGACQIANIPMTVGTGNYIVEQLWPLVDWGTDYFTRQISVVAGYRYMASADNTTINVNGAPLTTLNAGQFVEQGPVSQAQEVSANNPIYVMEYNYGLFWGNGQSGDPSMATVPAVDHWNNQYLFPVDPNGLVSPQHGVNLIVPASAVNYGVTLDGTPIPPSNFLPINGGAYYSSARGVSFDSPHFVSSAVSFMAMPNMLDVSDAYSFPSGGMFVDNGPTPTPYPSPTPFVVNPCKVLIYYDGEAGGAPVTNLVNLLQLEGALVTTLPVTTTVYNPSGDNWYNYGQVWDARFMPQTIFGNCGSAQLSFSDYFGPSWSSCAMNYLRMGGNLFLQAESDRYGSRNASSGLGAFLKLLGVVNSSFASCPDPYSGNFDQGDDSSLGQVNLPSTLPGTPSFFGDVVGGIPLSYMTAPSASLVHMATGWTHYNQDRSIVQGWSGAAQLPGVVSSNVGKVFMVWDQGMWTPADYSGLNGTTTNNFFTQVYDWMGGANCGGSTPTPFNTNTVTATPTFTPTLTLSPTWTLSPTLTLTPLFSYTPTFTSTKTLTFTATPSPTPTFTFTRSFTSTSTFTATPTETCTGTITISPTLTPSLVSNSFSIGPPYPNPILGAGDVTLPVMAPAGLHMKWGLFTTAFRKIREGAQDSIGNSHLVWDLKDKWDDPVANGVYYWRIEITGTTNVTKIFKILVIR